MGFKAEIRCPLCRLIQMTTNWATIIWMQMVIKICPNSLRLISLVSSRILVKLYRRTSGMKLASLNSRWLRNKMRSLSSWLIYSTKQRMPCKRSKQLSKSYLTCAEKLPWMKGLSIILTIKIPKDSVLEGIVVDLVSNKCLLRWTRCQYNSSSLTTLQMAHNWLHQADIIRTL